MKVDYPNGKKIAIMMAFDLDAESLWEAHSEDINIMSAGRGSYGPLQGMPRILNLMDKHEIKATFFIPGITVERYPEVAKEIVRCGHEIAYHGYTHESFPDKKREHDAILKTKKIIFDITGYRIVGQRAPSGTIYDYSLELFLEHGFIFSSNWRNKDSFFIHMINNKPIPIVELPKDSIFDDTAYDMYVDRPYQTPTYLRSAREFCQIWRDEFDALAKENKMINFVLHPQFIGRISRINALDELIKYMKDHDAWFETNGNVARYVLNKFGYKL